MQDIKKTNEQHAVPQNIMDVEFKIIGDLTMRQFIYLLVCAALGYICFLIIPSPFKPLFIVFFALLGVGLAFLPLEERGLDQWIINFFKSVYSPTQRVWRQEATLPRAFDYDQSMAMVTHELITLAPTASRRKLEEYLLVRDASAKEDDLDIPERLYVEKVREAFAHLEEVPQMPAVTSSAPQAHPVSGVAVPTIPSIQGEPSEAPLPEPSEPHMPSVEKKEDIVTEPTPESELEPVRTPVSAPLPVEPEEAVREEPPILPPQSLKKPLPPEVLEKPQEPVKEAEPIAPADISTTPDTSKPSEMSQPPEGPKEQEEPILKTIIAPAGPREPLAPTSEDQIVKPKLRIPRRMTRPEVPLTPMTPDMHSGRRFTNLTPGSGQLILPIRGEKVLATSEEQKLEEDMDNKVEQLKKLMQDVKDSEGVATQPPVDVKEEQKLTKAFEDAKSLKQELRRVEDIAREVRNMPLSVPSAENPQAPLPPEPAPMPSPRPPLPKQVPPEDDTPRVKPVVLDFIQATKPKASSGKAPTYIDTDPATVRPNIITGVVKNRKGNIQEGVVLIIKNHLGESVRALKTNSVGEFAISTPLENGTYTIEVDTTKKTGLSFDIISLELKGQALPSIEFVGN